MFHVKQSAQRRFLEYSALKPVPPGLTRYPGRPDMRLGAETRIVTTKEVRQIQLS